MINRTVLLQAAIFVIVLNVSKEAYQYYFGETPPVAVSDNLPVGAKPFVDVATDRSHLVKVSTDVMTVYIDRKGGRLIQADLPGYQEGDHTYSVLSYQDNSWLQAQAGFSGDESLLFSSAQKKYELVGDKIVVPLQANGKNGIRYVKEFVFERGDYRVAQNNRVINSGEQSVDVSSYYVFSGQKQYDLEEKLPSASTLSFDEGAASLASAIKGYSGVSHTTQKKPYKRVKFSDMKNNPALQTKGGWLAYQKHHFLAAWVFPEKSYRIKHYFTDGLSKQNEERFEQSFVSKASSSKVKLAPGATYTESATLYCGPQKLESMNMASPSLRLTLDYGFFWMFANLLHKSLLFIHKVVPSWSGSLVVLVLLFRLLFYRATQSTTEQAKKLAAIRPEKEAIEKRFADKSRFDSEKNEAMLALYKKHNIKLFSLSQFSPFLQIPLMMAFYGMVAIAVEFRGDRFLWLSDVSLPDPYYILPGLAVLMMYFQSQTMAVSDEFKMVSRFLPIMFAFFVMKAPASVQLYLAISVGLGVLQMKMTKVR